MPTLNNTQARTAFDALELYYELCDDFDGLDTKEEVRDHCKLLNEIRNAMVACSLGSPDDVPDAIDIDEFVAQHFPEERPE